MSTIKVVACALAAYFGLSALLPISAIAQHGCQTLAAYEKSGSIFTWSADTAFPTGGSWKTSKLAGKPGVAFQFDSQKLKQGETISSLAKAAGLATDQYNFALIKLANPGVADLDKVTPNQNIIIPKYLPNSENPSDRSTSMDGYSIWKPIFDAYRTDQSHVSKLRSNQEMIASFGFDAEFQEKFRTLLKSFESYLTSKPTSSVFESDESISRIQTDAQIRGGIAFLNSQLEGMRTKQVTSSDRQLFEKMTEDVQHKLASANSNGYFQIEVHTFSPTHEELKNLTIYYATQLSYDLGCAEVTKQPFFTFSSPATHTLTKSKFVIWAFEPASGKRSREEVRDFQNVPGNLQRIDYTVNWVQ